MPQYLYEYQYVLSVNRVRKTVDRRYKSGFRHTERLQTHQALLTPDMTTSFGFSSLHFADEVIVESEVIGNVSLTARTYEQVAR